jgi:ribosomal protein S18 acetylase RimI-like enzyme
MKKVDMSEEAILRRLKTVDQLRTLCLSLMRAKKESDAKKNREEEKPKRKIVHERRKIDHLARGSSLKMQITYRRLKPSESTDFRRVRLECLRAFPDVFGTLYEDEAGKAKLYFEEKIEQNGADVFFYGAFAGEKLIGIAGFVRGERTKTRHRGEIVSMYVDPAYRGARVGENLLRALLTEVFDTEGVEQVHLTAVADNRAAVGLYERIGFETFGVQKNYFKLGMRYWNQNFMQLMKEDFEAKC